MIIEKPEFEIKGKQAFITRQQPNLNIACSWYGRDPQNTCIKVFYGNPMKEGDTLKDALWGDMPLPPPSDTRKNTTVFAGSQVQNILWTKGISPRVFGIFEAEYNGMRVACQLTEFIEGECAEKIEDVYKIWNDTEAVGKEYGFTAQTKKMGVNDVIGGKNVDPQLWAWDKVSYKSVVERIYYEKGRYGKIYYQNDDELGFHGGPRHSEDRVKYMKLDEVDFKDKIVWDIGCAGGYFCRYADKHGAKRVIGFDMKDPLEAAFHAGNFLGHFNIDYVEADLSKGIPAERLPKADIAFFLSMNLHVGILEQLKDIPFVVFEDNSYDGRDKDVLGKPWTDWFNNIRFVGRGLDHGAKAVYWLNKEQDGEIR
jgi:hypothetical protein